MTTHVATWRLKGTVVLACNCDYGCPCNFNARPTHGHCEGGWTWQVEEGAYGDTRLDGLNFALLVDWPGAISEGKGEALILVDERANAAQRQVLETLVTGKAGGPWGILANTIAKCHGLQFVPYEQELNGVRSVVRAGQVLEMALEPIRNPVTGAEAYPRVVLPQGFVWKDGAMASSRSFWVRGEVSYDHSGKYAAVAPFEYSGP